LSKIQQGIGRMRLVDSVQEEFSLTPETAVNGLYVRTGSSLGLEHVADLAGLGS
jgi:hypothetical protein